MRPDSRYGFSLRFATVIQKLLNDSGGSMARIYETQSGEMTQGQNLISGFPQTNRQTIFQYELLLWASVSESSQFFFRTQFSHLRYNPSNTFFQLQLGYQFDVFTTNRSVVKPAALLP